FDIEIDELFIEAAAFVLFIGCHLTEKGNRAHRILIPDLAADHQSIAFFSPNDIVLAAFFFLDQLGYIFEARKHAITMDPVALGDGIDEIGGHDGLYDHIGRTGDPFGFSRFDHIVEGQCRRLVPVHQDPVTLFVFHANAYPVRVRVGTQQDVRVDLLRLPQSDAHGLAFFRVGIDHGGEVAIGCGLFVHHMDIGKAKPLQDLGHQLDPRTVDRGIDDPQIMLAFNYFGIYTQATDHGDIGLVDGRADHGD